MNTVCLYRVEKKKHRFASQLRTVSISEVLPPILLVISFRFRLSPRVVVPIRTPCNAHGRLDA